MVMEAAATSLVTAAAEAVAAVAVAEVVLAVAVLAVATIARLVARLQSPSIRTLASGKAMRVTKMTL